MILEAAPNERKENSFFIRPQLSDLGWGFLVAWGISIIFTGAFSGNDGSNLGAFWIASMAGAPCGLLLFFFSKYRLSSRRTTDTLHIAALTAMTVGTALLLVSLSTSNSITLVLQVTGGLISSLGTSVFTVLWGARFSSLNMRQIESFAAYSLLLAFSCYALVLFQP